jgi:hypothetical protein
MRSFFRREFKTLSRARSLAATRRCFTFHVADPLGSIHEFTLMIKQVASWCVTIGFGLVCNEKRAI